MNGKSLVEMRIPTEEVGNSEGYDRSRSDASRDMIRLGAANLRSSYRFVETIGGEKR
ncbi:hypothetical protein C5S31_00890 [ANME-1 cluster archaeon GoMg2]|nr:hypothetical protein [ANME-1 cluster archaeon GoMg2]